MYVCLGGEVGVYEHLSTWTEWLHSGVSLSQKFVTTVTRF